jgi:cyclopropane fatty-acyl-phospholipid synthase-like methyltransferase
MALNKWGQSVIKFKDRTENEKIGFVKFSVDVMRIIKDVFGVECCVTYGALLGVVREKSLIEHDDDIDIAFICENKSRAEVAALGHSIAKYFKENGYSVWVITNGQFSIGKQLDGIFAVVDVFALWVEGERYFLNFAIAGGVPQAAVLPLTKRYLYGHELLVPANPESVLVALYGQNWAHPDPDFKYQLAQKVIDTHYFFNIGINDNRYYWDCYYDRKDSREPWAEFPSQFALSVMPDLSGSEKMLEIGCGNGRDALYFASHGLSVLGVDYSVKSMEHCRKRSVGMQSANFEVLNLYDEIQVEDFCQKYSGQFDLIYTRFFLHAINASGERTFIDVAKRVLKNGGKIYSEFRTEHDPRMHKGDVLGETERSDGHYRRFINCQDLAKRINDAGLNMEYLVEGAGMARYRQEDPVVGRIISRKP